MGGIIKTTVVFTKILLTWNHVFFGVICAIEEPNIESELSRIVAGLEKKSNEHMHLDFKLDMILSEIRNVKTNRDLESLAAKVKTLEDDNKQFRQQVTDQLAIIQRKQTQKGQDSAERPNLTRSGSIYIRWGRKVCPQNGSRVIYDGFAAGGHYTHAGSSPSMLCLPREPVWGKYDDTHNSVGEYVYGVEYEHKSTRSNAIFGRSYHDMDVPCVACESERITHIMIPGRTTCYDGWTREYWGYLMAGHYSHKRQGDYHCIDAEPEFLQGGHTDQNGYLLYFVEVRCQSLRCPPYVLGRELPCVVCTK